MTCSAFMGFCMGSTATAMANMQAITARYGPAPQSYLIVPLAGAFLRPSTASSAPSPVAMSR